MYISGTLAVLTWVAMALPQHLQPSETTQCASVFEEACTELDGKASAAGGGAPACIRLIDEPGMCMHLILRNQGFFVVNNMCSVYTYTLADLINHTKGLKDNAVYLKAF